MPKTNPRTKRYFSRKGKGRYTEDWKPGQYEISYKKPQSIASMPVTGPMRIFRKLRYVDDYTPLQPLTAGVAVGHVFNLNSLYDPDETGAGNQPRGFDQYMAMYRNYVVLGARVTAKFVNISSSTFTRINMFPSRNSTIDSDPIDNIEVRHLRNCLVGPYTGGAGVKTLTMNWSAKNWFGRKTVLTEKDLEGTSASSPTKPCYLHVVADPFDASAGSSGVRVQMQIDYLVCFRTPTQPAQS